MRCPICKNETFRSWEGPLEMMGVTVPARGEACKKCGEVLFTDANLKRNERQVAVMLSTRGVRSGKEFKFVRKVAGITAVDFAGLIGVRPETVSRWERDEIMISRMAAFVLGEFLAHPKTTRERFEQLSAIGVGV